MWPSIDNLSQVIDSKLRAFASSADLAATVIARALHKRLRRSCVLTEWRARIFAGKVVYKKDILDLFLRTEFEYSFKYDGTNVGVGDDLRLRGRKTLIPQDAETYQRVTLDHAKACLGKTNAVKHELMLDDKVRLVIHGELMCNANKFDYSERKLVAKFFAFGATIQMAEVSLLQPCKTPWCLVLFWFCFTFCFICYRTQSCSQRLNMNKSSTKLLQNWQPKG